MVTSVRDALIDNWFPAAANDGYDLTSSKDDYYNCIAWAAGNINIPWWPVDPPQPGVYWPPGVPREQTLRAFMQAYATLRYQDCGMNGRLQWGYEKIVIYVGSDGRPTHAARQLYNGDWTSKIGIYRDIHHTTPGALEVVPSRPPQKTDYGIVARYMRRKRKKGDLCLRTPDAPDIPPYKESTLVKLIRWPRGRRGASPPAP